MHATCSAKKKHSRTKTWGEIILNQTTDIINNETAQKKTAYSDINENKTAHRLRRDISVKYMTIGWKSDLIPDREEHLSLCHHIQIGYGALTAYYPMGTEGSCPRN
jgi:hypothetical protein